MKSLLILAFSAFLIPTAIAQDHGSSSNKSSVSDKYIGCFDGYCPCDTGDPDYGGVDEIVCRQLRNGIRVDREIMAIAASARDARRQMREFKW
jgi:hypothetical protein